MKVLENVKMGMSWTSYIASAWGALSASGLWDGEIYQLMGMTGMVFHFIMHEVSCPSSVTVYDWKEEHINMMDRIGIYSDIMHVLMDSRLNTEKLIREDAIKRIRESIDQGVSVVIWAPTSILEFGLIYGYDDEEKIFIVRDCMNQTPDPLLYSNLGKSEVPWLSVQRFFKRIKVEKEKIYRDSLLFGISEWKREFHVNPCYASGSKAYDSLIGTLERGDFNEFGLTYTMAVYADSKESLSGYLGFLLKNSKEIGDLAEPVQHSRQLADNFKKIAKLLPFIPPTERKKPLDRTVIPQVLKLVKESKDIEEKIVENIEKAL